MNRRILPTTKLRDIAAAGKHGLTGNSPELPEKFGISASSIGDSRPMRSLRRHWFVSLMVVNKPEAFGCGHPVTKP